MTEDNLEDDPVEEVLDVTETPPNVFFVPKLLTAPVEDVLVDDARVPIEDTPAVWPDFLELEIAVPVRDALREIGPLTIELVRLARVPALLCKLFLEPEVLLKEGSGDLERELLALREGILLPLAMAVVEWAGAIDDFFLGPRGGGPILAFGTAGSVVTFVTVGLGILLVIAGAGAFPRFHTL